MRTFNYQSELSVAFSGHRLVPRVLRKQVKNLLHPDQTTLWDEKDKELYNKVLKKANRRILLSDSYSRDSLLKRNDYLLVNSSLLIAFYNGNKRGGTYYTYRRALRKGMDVINLYDRIET